jgi:pimeloyl-ACP methyl ester carboxylesterase
MSSEMRTPLTEIEQSSSADRPSSVPLTTPSVVFDRRPAAQPPVRELVLEVGGVRLSGLLAEPQNGVEPRALVIALHGAGVHAGYFDLGSDRRLSLLALGGQLGFTVWAPDRPGVGLSAGLDDHRLGLFQQAHLLLEAIELFRAQRSVGGGAFVVGHSYGLKVGFAMIAEAGDGSFLGLDGSGSGVQYAFEWGKRRDRPRSERDQQDGGDHWGPRWLYPPQTFQPGTLPVHRVPPAQAAEGGRWPDDFRKMAPRISVPVRLTFGEHERLWRLDEGHFEELRSLLAGVPRLTITIQPNAGHNISLGWAARPYHLQALAFAEECLLPVEPEVGPTVGPPRGAPPSAQQ